MLLLETPANVSFSKLSTRDISRCFRKKGFQFHPDRLLSNASEKDKEQAKTVWLAYLMARDTLLEIKNENIVISQELEERIDALVDQERIAQKVVDTDKLLEKLRNVDSTLADGITKNPKEALDTNGGGK